jgi:hypothetical protein
MLSSAIVFAASSKIPALASSLLALQPCASLSLKSVGQKNVWTLDLVGHPFVTGAPSAGRTEAD